jgi:hypothetical protein
VEGIGQTVFYIASAAGAVAAVIYVSGLVWMLIIAIRDHGA